MRGLSNNFKATFLIAKIICILLLKIFFYIDKFLSLVSKYFTVIYCSPCSTLSWKMSTVAFSPYRFPKTQSSLITHDVKYLLKVPMTRKFLLFYLKKHEKISGLAVYSNTLSLLVAELFTKI